MIKTICYITLSIIFSSTLYSCNKNQSKINKESISIMTLLYNKEASNFPIPPPPKDFSEEKMSPLLNPELQKYDSDKIIYKGKFIIVAENEESKPKLNSEIFPLEFQKIYSNPKNKMFITDIKNLNLHDSFHKKIPVVCKKGLRIQDLAELHKALGVVFFSEINFNKTFDKAILVFGSYTHELAGSTSVIGLEKIKGKWVVIYGQLLSES